MRPRGFKELDDFGGRPGGFGNVYKVDMHQYGVGYAVLGDKGGLAVAGSYQKAVDQYYNSKSVPFDSALEARYVKANIEGGSDVYDLGPVPPKSNLLYVEPLLPPRAVVGSPLQTRPIPTIAPAPTVVFKPAVAAQAPTVKAVVTVNWWDQMWADFLKFFGVK